MIPLHFPVYPFKIREKSDGNEIWDNIRKMWLVLTSEEWVRQHLIHFLIEEKKFPKGLFALESGLKVNGMRTRTDVVIYSTEGKPLFLAECKAPKIKITQHVFDQAAKYNTALQAPYLMVTNGLIHYCCRINRENASFEFLSDIPSYLDLKAL